MLGASMEPRELAELPYAAALRPHRGDLEPGEDYDSVHFDQLAFDDAAAANARFIECAFTQVSFQAGQFRRSRFTHVWLHDVRMMITSLGETAWQNSRPEERRVGKECRSRCTPDQ